MLRVWICLRIRAGNKTIQMVELSCIHLKAL